MFAFLHHIIFFCPFTAKTLCFRNIAETPPHHITLGIPSLPIFFNDSKAKNSVPESSKSSDVIFPLEV